MARKKPPKTEPEVTPTADRPKNAVMSFRPPSDIRAIIEALAEEERRSSAQVIQILVEEALKARDLWSPQKQGGR